MNDNKQQGGKKKKSKAKNKASSGTPATALAYRGPVALPGERLGIDMDEVVVLNTGTLTTGVSGLLNTVFDWYLQASSSTDWTSLLALWSEYRILGMEVTCVPWNTFNQPTTTSLAPVFSVVDRSNNSALTTSTATVNHASCRLHKAGAKFKREVLMEGSDEAQFVEASATPVIAARAFIKLFTTGGTASTNLYDFVAKIRVQVRLRK